MKAKHLVSKRSYPHLRSSVTRICEHHAAFTQAQFQLQLSSTHLVYYAALESKEMILVSKLGSMRCQNIPSDRIGNIWPGVLETSDPSVNGSVQ